MWVLWPNFVSCPLILVVEETGYLKIETQQVDSFFLQLTKKHETLEFVVNFFACTIFFIFAHKEFEGSFALAHILQIVPISLE